MANEKCKNEAEHEGHLCVLASKGLFKEIKGTNQKPKIYLFHLREGSKFIKESL